MASYRGRLGPSADAPTFLAFFLIPSLFFLPATIAMGAAFAALQPQVFHIGDGYRTSEKDHHLNFGDGDFDLARLVAMVPDHATLTIETPTDLSLGLEDFRRNAEVLSALLAGRTDIGAVGTQGDGNEG